MKSRSLRKLRRLGERISTVLSYPAAWLFRGVGYEEKEYEHSGGCFSRPLGLFQGSSFLLPNFQAVASTPRLILSSDIWQEMFFYFLHALGETQLMGFVEMRGGSIFSISELVITPHYASAGYATLDQDAFPAWLDVMEAQGKDIKKLRVRIHSHGELGVFCSIDDMEAIGESLCDWEINIVGNRRGELLVRLDIFKPIVLSLAIPVFIQPPLIPATDAQREVWLAKLKQARKF